MACAEKACTCAFTGHRESKLPWGSRETDARCLRLKESLLSACEQAYEDGCRHFLTGMASGCDLYFAEAVLHLRDTFPGITLEAAIPFPGQAEHWRETEKQRYARILSACDVKTMVQDHYSAGCMMRRNRYMVDHASMLIAAYNGTPGGTRNTLLYAMRQGLRIITLTIDTAEGD